MKRRRIYTKQIPRSISMYGKYGGARLVLTSVLSKDGKSEKFSCPVVILKTCSINAALVVPLTTRDKKGAYYFDLGKVGGKDAKAVLSQVRFIDKCRLIKKFDVINKDVFEKLQSAIIQINFT